jgi:hypothetical protein
MTDGISRRLRPPAFFLEPPFFVFFIFFVISGATVVGYMNSVDGSQYALTRSIAEDQSLNIRPYFKFATPDYALDKHGNPTSDREPFPSFLAVPFHYRGEAIDSVSRLPYDGDHSNLTDDTRVQVVTYLSSVFFISLGLAYGFVLLKRLEVSSGAAFAACMLIGFGTLVWKYSSSFHRHPVVGILLLLVVLHALHYRKERRNLDLALMGVFAGVALGHDYLVGIPLGLLGVLFVIQERPGIRGLAIALGSAAPFVVLILVYNELVFGKLITSPHEHEAHVTFISDLSNTFRAPLHLSLYLNILSFGQLPESAMQWLLDRPDLAVTQGADWALRAHYKGILVQSPFLVLSLAGWVLARGFDRRALVYPAAIVLSWLPLMSAFTLFWSPTQYDTRLLLALIPTLGVGVAFFIDWAAAHRSTPLSTACRWTLGVAALVSIYFAWESVVTNFGPNLSGLHRWDPRELMTVRGVSADTLQTAFLETFPNIYNLHILIGMAVVLYGVSYLAAVGIERGVNRLSWQALYGRPQLAGNAAGGRQMMPGGAVRTMGSAACFVVVLVALVLLLRPSQDAAQSLSQQAVTATTLAPGDQRDAVRLEDLKLIEGALIAHLENGGTLPDTTGNVQTLCTYPVDVGCFLEGVIGEVPKDPRGANFGYYYQSNGERFIVFADWEGANDPPDEFSCPDWLDSSGESNRACVSYED